MTKRFELKYRMPGTIRPYLLSLWEPFLIRAPHTGVSGRYPVLSQYYDSPGFTFYHNKMDGVGRRSKVRLRSYERRFTAGRPCFLEIKNRTQESISKTRTALPPFRSEFLDPERWSEVRQLELGPFSLIHHLHQLRPSAQVLYLREPYAGVIDPGLRITFDSSIFGLYPDETWTNGLAQDRERELLPDTEVLLEVKVWGELPGWVEEGIRWAELQQIVNSKYTLAVEALNLLQINTEVYL